MEHFVHILVSGLLVGILVSAPMGPVGMLIIQRTLNRGRWPAFATGVGAAFSDLFYCLLTGLGLSFVLDFVESNKLIIQLIGSVFIIAFAIYLFQKNPARALYNKNELPSKKVRDGVTGFLFTFSNPLILFFIIGLYGRFDFLLPEFKYYHYIVGYTGIFVGAILWWYLVTFLINKLQSRFNVRSMWLLNRIIGSLLLVMALVGIYQSIAGFIEQNVSNNEQIITHSIHPGT